MKRVGFLMEKISDLDNLYLAFRKSIKGKRRKAEVRRFAEHLDSNLSEMRRDLIDGSIAVGDYRYFTIYDPKKRTICAAPIRERILQHAIMNVCHQYFDRTLIDSTYAARKGKGVYAALDRAVMAMSRHKYTVKMDFRKYYDSIDHRILKRKLRRMFKDEALLALFDKIIDSYCVANGKGLPIGNLTSQYFANVYLSELDHMSKETWRVSEYIRYMDDILIAGNDNDMLRKCVRQMYDYSSSSLGLILKPPIFRKSDDGQVFLGYKVMPFRYVLSGRSKKRFRSKLLAYDRYLKTGVWTDDEYEEHILPLLSFVKHASSESFRRACISINTGC